MLTDDLDVGLYGGALRGRLDKQKHFVEKERKSFIMVNCNIFLPEKTKGNETGPA